MNRRLPASAASGPSRSNSSIAGRSVPPGPRGSEAQRGRPGEEPLVDDARAGDLRPLDEVLLRVPPRLHAGRAGHQASTAAEEVLDQLGERLEWRDVGRV